MPGTESVCERRSSSWGEDLHVHHVARRRGHCPQDDLKTVKYQGRGVPCKLMLYSLACYLPQANAILCPPPSHPVAMPPQYIFPFPLLDPPFTAAYAQTDAPASPGKTGACRPSKSRYPAPPKMHQHPPPHTTPFREKRKKTHRLQPLLNLRVQRPPLDRNHRRRLGVVRDRRPALGAEPPVHGVAAVGRALPLLDGARGGEFVFGDYDDEG